VRFNQFLNVFIFLFICIFWFSTESCKKNNLDTEASLSFSEDTVYFDTVFVTLGTITKRFKVYNKADGRISISRIRLAGGNSSPFILNVDGTPSNDLRDIEIEANDSIFIFAESTIDPNNDLLPFVVLDSIVFETNGNIQDVKLLAYGQNADFYRPNVFPTNGFPPYSVLTENTTWTNELPKVIIGYLVVDSSFTLTIEAGTTVHLYNNSGLWVYRDGRLRVNGTLQDSVVFKGVRKESFYESEPGQWDRIWINQGSTDNLINYAVIKNGNIGIQAENLPELGEGIPTGLTISNTQIKNMKGFGLYGVNFTINAWNNVISNCGSHALALIQGGNYTFRHCTVSNFWSKSVRSAESVFLSNYVVRQGNVANLADLTFNFFNGIVWGNLQNENEIKVDSLGATLFNYRFQNSLLKVDDPDIPINNPIHFTNNILNQDPLFVDGRLQNHTLTALSPARNIGSAIIVNLAPAIPQDILGNNRLADEAPDAGAYEFGP